MGKGCWGWHGLEKLRVFIAWLGTSCERLRLLLLQRTKIEGVPRELAHRVAEVADDEGDVVHAGALPAALDHTAEVGRDLGDDLVRHLSDVGGVVQVPLDEESDVVVDRVRGVGDGSVSVVESV